MKLLSFMLLDCVSFPPISCQLPEGRAVSLSVPRLPVLGSQNNAEKETDGLRELSVQSPVLSGGGDIQKLGLGRMREGREQETSFL